MEMTCASRGGACTFDCQTSCSHNEVGLLVRRHSQLEQIVNLTVYEDKYFQIVSPEFPLNCRDDGGHLVLLKREKVTDRSDMTYQEAIAFMRASMIIGRAMYDVLGIERMNYEDLGNWGVDDPGGAKMHLHFFGRSREQIHQIRGHHMFLYPKGHKIYEGHLKAFTEQDVANLKARMSELVREPKYVKMAELAEL
jgi:diadenosine tetraphosphate (Ap4A) HIT family hydrolase